MIRLLFVMVLAALVVVSQFAPVAAQDKREPSPKEKPDATLKVGDPAPALKVTKWFRGDAVRTFEPGHVYVVEFWATWCAPCILFMPHLAELQDRYKAKGVTIIGYSARDDINTEEKVTAFVRKRGPKLGYRFAFGDNRATYDAWMKAAGQEGIPCTFVVDKAGRIAYIGHPLYLGEVVPKVLAGVKADEIRDDRARIHEEGLALDRAMNGPDAKASLTALDKFEAKYPFLANNPYRLRQRVRLLCDVGKLDELKQLVDAAEARATRYGDSLELWMVSAALLDKGKGNKELLALAVRGAEAMIEKAGDNDPRALLHLANAYFATGDKAKTTEFAKKAIDATAGEPAALRELTQREAKSLIEKNEEKK